MLQFLPALLLLLVNGHLVGHGDLAMLAQTERVIWALSQPEGKLRANEREAVAPSVRLIIRALAWVTRWQSPAPETAAESASSSPRPDWPQRSVRLPSGLPAGDRSRDGPAHALLA